MGVSNKKVALESEKELVQEYKLSNLVSEIAESLEVVSEEDPSNN